MTLPEFLALTGVADRTMRHWTKLGLVPQPEFGLGTSGKGYTDAQVLRVKAIEGLRKSGVLKLDEVRRRLDAMSEAEMRAIAGLPEPIPAPVAPVPAPVVASETSLARRDDAMMRSDEAITRSDASIAPKDAPFVSIPASFGLRATPVVENHVRIALRDGVFLDVRVPIDGEGLALVQKIAAMCGVRVDVS
jgi:DNA-binding transcriptional MerR regulator